MRSRMFANLESEFKSATKDRITEIARKSLQDIVINMSSVNTTARFGVLTLGAQLGVAGDGYIGDEEKHLIDEIFRTIWKGQMEELYSLIREPISEDSYNLVRMVTKFGNPVSTAFLHFILCFAYIDGIFENDVAEKLDGIFGMTLLANFVDSGLEEVFPFVLLS